MTQMKEHSGYIKKLVLLFSLIFTMSACITEDVIIEVEDISDIDFVAENRTICTDGFAGVFPCLNYSLFVVASVQPQESFADVADNVSKSRCANKS